MTNTMELHPPHPHPSYIKSALTPYISSNLNSLSIETETARYDESNSARDLKEAGVLTDTSSHVVSIEAHAGGEIIGKVLYVICPTEDVAYIRDLTLDVDYQDQGLGSTIWKVIVEHLCPPLTIYSYPTNAQMIHIATKEGFENSSNPSLEGWYVKRPR